MHCETEETAFCEESIVLISCGKTKQTLPCSAGEMYCSKRFVSIKNYAIKQNYRWYVVSAKHGIISPEIIIEPYDVCLSSLSKLEIAEWSDMVLTELQSFSGATRFIVFADEYYTSIISYLLKESGFPNVIFRVTA